MVVVVAMSVVVAVAVMVLGERVVMGMGIARTLCPRYLLLVGWVEQSHPPGSL